MEVSMVGVTVVQCALQSSVISAAKQRYDRQYKSQHNRTNTRSYCKQQLVIRTKFSIKEENKRTVQGSGIEKLGYFIGIELNTTVFKNTPP